MQIEESAQREAARSSRKVAEHSTDIIDQFAKIGLYKEDFRVGGANEANFFNPNSRNNVVNSVNITTLDSAGELQKGAFTNAKFDQSTTGDAIVETVESTYQSSDTAQGTYSTRQITNLTGLGLFTNSAKNADISSKLYNRDADEIAALQNVLKSSNSNATYVTSVTSNNLRADLNNNIKIIDAELGARGINGENLTIKDIDKMIGGRGKHSYGNQQSHIHYGESRVFTGSHRDSFSGAKDSLMRRNTGWAGRDGRGGVIIDDDLGTLLKEKRRLIDMQKKLDPYNRPGGFEDGVGRRSMQDGVIGLGRAWIYESMNGSDFGEGYSTVRMLNTTAKATTLLGTGLSSGLQSASLQSINSIKQMGNAIGKGAYNFAGNIYSRGNPVRAQKWAVDKARINARFDARSKMWQDHTNARQKVINQNTKKKVEFLQQTTWNKTKATFKSTINGAKWAINRVGNTAFGRAVGAGARFVFAPVWNVLAAPVGRVVTFATNTWSTAHANYIAAKLWKNRLAQRWANSTVGKILRAPFSAFNWVTTKLQQLLIWLGILVLKIVVIDAAAMLLILTVVALLPSVGEDGGKELFAKLEAVEYDFANNIIDYYTNDVMVVVGQEDCSGCTVISGLADCLSCNKKGGFVCAFCNGMGCTLTKQGIPNVDGHGNSSAMIYKGCTACGGSGTLKLYYNAEGIAFSDGSIKYGIGAGICTYCGGDGSLNTTCLACKGAGVIYIEDNCKHYTASGEIVPHSVLFHYNGAPNTSYANLSTSTNPGPSFTKSDGTQTFYDRGNVYSAIMSMASVATQGIDDEKLMEDYCKNILSKLLHTSTVYHPPGGVSTIDITLYNAGITDLMKLEGTSITCSIEGCCGKTFPAITKSWMRQYDFHSKWKGWKNSENFKAALEWYKQDVDDWQYLEVDLPSTSGTPLNAQNIDAFIGAATNSLGGNGNLIRIEVIRRALYEMNCLHVYGNNGWRLIGYGDTLPAELDCSSFVLGLLQSTGVRSPYSGGSTETIVRFTDTGLLRPGDLLLKYKPGHNVADKTGDYNHVMMFLGYDIYGKPMLIECTTDENNYILKHGDIYIRTYDSIAAMKAARGINYIKNPYGD